MKTKIRKSSILVIVALAFILTSLVLYDISLRDAFLTGDYKKPFRDYISLNFKDFKSITLNASTAANVIVEPGPFSVKIEPTARDFVKVSQKGDMLYIDAVFPGSFEDSRAMYPLVITCPVLEKFNTDARYTTDGVAVTDTLATSNFDWRASFISGFTLDSLTVNERHASAVILKANKIKNFKASIGLDEHSGSNMVILKDNQLDNADLDVLNRSRLKLEDAAIPNLKLRLADSARLILNGASRKLLKN
ncbi:MAG: hypothetical protein ACTHMI_21405 [Mucilaginibacter sp.]